MQTLVNGQRIKNLNLSKDHKRGFSIEDVGKDMMGSKMNEPVTRNLKEIYDLPHKKEVEIEKLRNEMIDFYMS